MTFTIVLVGWLFSLCLHEFSHALVAYYGGDYTVKEKGYLTFNLFKYTHPVYSILLPLLFLAMGGIGLPGGAVYIETWRLRSPKWVTAVSLAGPASNLILAIILAIVLRLAPLSESPTSIWPGLAFLTYLQISAVLFNLIPLPPFDGYGALRPHLSDTLRESLDTFGQFSMMIILFAFWVVPGVSTVFWDLVNFVTRTLGLPFRLIAIGYQFFQFWVQR